MSARGADSPPGEAGKLAPRRQPERHHRGLARAIQAIGAFPVDGGAKRGNGGRRWAGALQKTQTAKIWISFCEISHVDADQVAKSRGRSNCSVLLPGAAQEVEKRLRPIRIRIRPRRESGEGCRDTINEANHRVAERQGGVPFAPIIRQDGNRDAACGNAQEVGAVSDPKIWWERVEDR